MSLTFSFFMSSFLSDNFQSHIEKIQKEKEIIELRYLFSPLYNNV